MEHTSQMPILHKKEKVNLQIQEKIYHQNNDYPTCT